MLLRLFLLMAGIGVGLGWGIRPDGFFCLRGGLVVCLRRWDLLAFLVWLRCPWLVSYGVGLSSICYRSGQVVSGRLPTALAFP
jgi:hypothetical protein